MQLSCWFTFSLLIEAAYTFFWGGYGYGYGSGYGSGYGYGITYQLYTRLNPVNGQPLTYGNLNSIAYSNFNNNRPTRLVIHGSAQNGRSAISRDLKNSFLARGDYNVIITDWSSVSSPYYQYARNKVGTTGIAVSRFIEWLNVNYGTLQVIGYDLGAHVAGIAGKNSARGRISRIIGLDPSKPLVNENTSANRLSIGDGSLVEIFHSNGGQLGIFTPSGDVDYYLNNGRTQPECAGSNNDCSHYRAVIIYSRLLTGQNNFVVVPCENIEQVATGCSLDPIEILLEELSPSGIYQINTVNAEALKDQVEIIP